MHTATRGASDANHQQLIGAIGGVRSALERHVARARGEDVPAAQPDCPSAHTLDWLGRAFKLSSFERQVVLLCAAVELDAKVAALCATAHADPARGYATFSLALAALADPHWSALAPNAPLRWWRMLDVGSGAGLTLAPLRLDERILHFLTGLQYLDERLASVVEPLAETVQLAPSQRVVAERLTSLWARQRGGLPRPTVTLSGTDHAAKRAVAAAGASALGLTPYLLSARLLPTRPSELASLTRLCEREVVLARCALVLDCEDLDSADDARRGAVNWLIDRFRGPAIVIGREPIHEPSRRRPAVGLDVARPTSGEQHALWQVALGDLGSRLNGEVKALASQFDLGAPAIQAASSDALARVAGAPGPDVVTDLVWDACRVQARPGLDNLAQRIEPRAQWADLILPAAQLQLLHELAGQVRQRALVYDEWGFANTGQRGLGISALFAGSSGTGKTMAAEVLGHALRLDLYRIDLSAVVSKYIGETEKNLRRVFDAAEAGGAILLFDEADALFGKRSEVKDSHDRYANIEVSYLLQRMEAYRGLAILTTNLKGALDVAFMRRLRFVVHFPFPDVQQRAELWRRAFPPGTPTEDLRIEKLARLTVSGGNIRSIALNAAFLAADSRGPVRMRHVLRAAEVEYAKLEKSIVGAEVEGWLD
jgi:ATPase family associated with various cellular activities (AAA)/Winged helix domain, variant